MRKQMLLGVVLCIACAVLSGCGANSSSGMESRDVFVAQSGVDTVSYDVEIREKMFVTQTNDIYINVDEYLGKGIKLEGMFQSSFYEPTESTYYSVMRYGPGCCGTDGVVGFEVVFEQDAPEIPADNDWVEAIGILEQYEELGQQYLRLNLTSLAVLNKRGAETVLQ